MSTGLMWRGPVTRFAPSAALHQGKPHRQNLPPPSLCFPTGSFPPVTLHLSPPRQVMEIFSQLFILLLSCLDIPRRDISRLPFQSDFSVFVDASARQRWDPGGVVVVGGRAGPVLVSQRMLRTVFFLTAVWAEPYKLARLGIGWRRKWPPQPLPLPVKRPPRRRSEAQLDSFNI